MKKNKTYGLLEDISLLKMLKIMRFTIFILLVSVSQTFAVKSYAQLAKISLDMKDVSVEEVIDQIESKSEYFFMYNNDLVDVSRKVDIKVEEIMIDQVLDKLFQNTEVSYSIQDRHIFLMKRDLKAKNILQQKSVSGKITDSYGIPLPGATILVKGSTNGTISDIDGNYTLLNVPANSVLVYSFIGMRSQEISFDGRANVNVTLSEETIGLNEVIAVGYGTQKKVNLTGSISSVSEKELESRPITQSSQALAGIASGVTVSQGSGRPGNDGATIRIRGMGTFSGAGNDPLVLIDGLASSINDVDPNNIKSISVLKDAASAAIYGTRAANGVILIETKRGEKGKLQISYSNYVGWQQVTELPDFVNSWEYATLKGGYSDDQIAKYKDGSDPDNYPNSFHLKDLLNSGSGFQTNHNLNFKGGDEKNSYLLSLGYLDQDGVVAKNNYKKYNFLLNFDSKLKENLNLRFNVSGNSANTYEPRASHGDMMNMIAFAVREPNVYAGRKSDGTYGHQDAYSPTAWIDSESFVNRKNHHFLGGIELSWEIINGLTISGKAGYRYNAWTDNSFISTIEFDANTSITPNSLSVSSGDNSLITLQSLLRYEKSIGDHSFNILGGFSQEEYRQDWTTASRDEFPNNSLYELNAGAGSNMQSYGSASAWGLRSYFGRINYSYKQKYLLEANARYDGTSRFPSDGRWGFFPSVSAGWRISEESFIKDNYSWIDNLKFRASWGKLGNQNIGEYPYQDVLGLGQNYTFGGSLASGARLINKSNPDIKWESTQVTDIGVDMTFFNGMLSMTLDYFDKTTSDILYPISVSGVLGLSSSEVNGGEVNNKGFEVILNYQKSFGDLHFGLSPNFSYYRNEVTKLMDGKLQDIGKGLFVGESLNSIYGYVTDGLFIDVADIDSYATQPYSAEPGFVRYKDISGPDGVPDGSVDATYDRDVIGSTLPKYSFGATITADYKGFDFSVLLQGLAGFEKQMGSYQAFALYNGGNIQKWQAENAWTEDNPNRNAVYPKITGLNMGSGTIQTSTYWNRDASFLRLKNLQIGYTFSNEITQKLKINKLRVFFSGQNLISWNHFYKGWDPEMYQSTGDNSPFYPITSIYTFGVNVKF
ncbi:MAG: TonB-dependent receptor [Labilibaculum sp.]|nr:TonB-dependent receptor [Labilibaculum sp.]